MVNKEEPPRHFGNNQYNVHTHIHSTHICNAAAGKKGQNGKMRTSAAGLLLPPLVHCKAHGRPSPLLHPRAEGVMLKLAMALLAPPALQYMVCKVHNRM